MRARARPFLHGGSAAYVLRIRVACFVPTNAERAVCENNDKTGRGGQCRQRAACFADKSPPARQQQRRARLRSDCSAVALTGPVLISTGAAATTRRSRRQQAHSKRAAGSAAGSVGRTARCARYEDSKRFRLISGSTTAAQTCKASACVLLRCCSWAPHWQRCCRPHSASLPVARGIRSTLQTLPYWR